jgi:hypothetical protein
MSVKPGKRKRVGNTQWRSKNDAYPSSSDTDDHDRIQEIFRQHFEAKFKPLPESKPQGSTQLEDESEEDENIEEEEWLGCSSDGDDAVIEIDYTNTFDSVPHGGKNEYKAFMVYHARKTAFDIP